MADNILTISQVRKAIYADDDFEGAELERLAEVASSFIKQKTGYDFTQDSPIDPLAIQCASMYVRQLHFNAQGYNRDFDYSLGIVGLLVDLKNKARAKENEESEAEESED